MPFTPPYILAGQDITAQVIQNIQPGPWTAISLSNSWTNAGSGMVAAQYRLRDSVTTQIIGVIQPGTVTAGTAIFVLPSGFYNPNSDQYFVIGDRTSSPTLSGFANHLNGNVQIEIAATTGHTYILNALIPLDS